MAAYLTLKGWRHTPDVEKNLKLGKRRFKTKKLGARVFHQSRTNRKCWAFNYLGSIVSAKLELHLNSYIEERKLSSSWRISSVLLQAKHRAKQMRVVILYWKKETLELKKNSQERHAHDHYFLLVESFFCSLLPVKRNG